MHIGRAHIDFWLRKNMPKWAVENSKTHHSALGNIDTCVNVHGGIKDRTCTDTHNLMVLVRMWEKRKLDIREHLLAVSNSHHHTTSAKRRALAKKWLGRLNRQG